MALIKLCSRCASAANDAFKLLMLNPDGKTGKCGHCGKKAYLLEYEVKKHDTQRNS